MIKQLRIKAKLIKQSKLTLRTSWHQNWPTFGWNSTRNPTASDQPNTWWPQNENSKVRLRSRPTHLSTLLTYHRDSKQSFDASFQTSVCDRKIELARGRLKTIWAMHTTSVPEWFGSQTWTWKRSSMPMMLPQRDTKEHANNKFGTGTQQRLGSVHWFKLSVGIWIPKEQQSSETRHVSTYARCPSLLESLLQTELAVSKAKGNVLVWANPECWCNADHGGF
jgi:hypothetical protein